MQKYGKYRNIIGFLLFLAIRSCPDIAPSVSILSHYANVPNLFHMKAAHRVRKYLKSTEDNGLRYERNMKAPLLYAFCDSGFAEDKGDCKS